jgi:ATP-dependent RNA helicase RhlE
VPFTTLGLPTSIVKGVRAAGFIEPTPIQVRAIPVILRGHDLIAAPSAAPARPAYLLTPSRLAPPPP